MTDDRKHVWVQPGGTYQCSARTFNGVTINIATPIEIEGTVISAPDENTALTPPPPSSPGGESPVQYPWTVPTADAPTGGGQWANECLVTDWYDGFGIYLHTDINECYAVYH